jgi:hypothetical protein
MNPQENQPVPQPVQPPQPNQQNIQNNQGGQQPTSQPIAPAGPPQLVYVTRPHDPAQPELSPEQLRKHEESEKRYPYLNLSKGEFVISAVKRHPIGLLQIWLVAGVLMAIVFAIAFALAGGNGGNGSGLSPEVMAIPAALVSGLILLFAFIATGIYNANKFFLTNESVIQLIQTGIFAKKEQTVSLSNIEDASYQQHGLLPHMLNYGMLRLSTEGDETTYRFSYASNPQKQIAVLNNAVEAFKNGRPVTGENEE